MTARQKIPKIIHYCWFGGRPLPAEIKARMKTWSEKCPDYEIMEWNEKNFDINKYRYTQEAFEHQKWAFISDVCRIEKVYEYGGIYLDVNTEVIRNLDKFLSDDMFVGFEQDGHIAGRTFGAKKHHPFMKSMLDNYYTHDRVIYNDNEINLKTINDRFQEELLKRGIRPDNTLQKIRYITVYPKEYFCPGYWDSPKLDKFTENTHVVDYYSASWRDMDQVEIARMREENARLNAELDSFLSIKRSARLVIGNIKRKLIRKTEQKREARHKRLLGKLKNPQVSIISRNCIAGFFYHDLGLRFNSPTINLWMRLEDFNLYLKHLREFTSSGKLTELAEDGIDYPVGVLACEVGSIRIYFQHYRSFPEAKAKWVERSKRIDFNNILVINEWSGEADKKLLQEFDALPYPRLIFGNFPTNTEESHHHVNIYDKDYFPGKIMEYRNNKSACRWYDENSIIRAANRIVK